MGGPDGGRLRRALYRDIVFLIFEHSKSPAGLYACI